MRHQRKHGAQHPGTVSRRTVLSGCAATLGAVGLAGVVRTPVGLASPSDTVVLRWNEVVLDAVRQGPLGPPMVARALGIVHTCIYDAWAAYDAKATGTRLGGALRRPPGERTSANKAEAVSYAAHSAATDVLGWNSAQIDEFMRSLGYDPAHHPSNSSPAGIGRTAAAAVLRYRHADGANQITGYTHTTGYTPVNDPMVVSGPIDPATVRDPNRWQPLTYPDRTGATVTPRWLAPHWYRVKPFAMDNGAELRGLLRPVAAWGTDAFRKQCDEVLTISAGLEDRQKAIAEYFADGPSSEQPPGHAMLFAQFVSRRDHNSLDQDVKLFFLVGNAVFDAGIAAWDGKRAYDSVRPITGIRLLHRGQQVTAWAGPGQGTGRIDGGRWLTYQPTWFPTPPFGEYPSGHSTFSAAAAEVLRRFTGSDTFGYSATVRAGSSNVEPGYSPARDVTVSYPTFSAAANDAGISRRYGGIHFAQGDLDARVLGRAVGQNTWNKAQAYFQGDA